MSQPENAAVPTQPLLDPAVSPSKTKRRTREIAKLDSDKLLSDAGLPALLAMFKKTKFKGEAFQNGQQLMRIYHVWAQDLFPKLTLQDFLTKTERIYLREQVNEAKRIKMGIYAEDEVQNPWKDLQESDDEVDEEFTIAPELVQEGPIDGLAMELFGDEAPSQSQPVSFNLIQIDSTPLNNTSVPDDSVDISSDILEKVEMNRLRALSNLAQRKQQKEDAMRATREKQEEERRRKEEMEMAAMIAANSSLFMDE